MQDVFYGSRSSERIEIRTKSRSVEPLPVAGCRFPCKQAKPGGNSWKDASHGTAEWTEKETDNEPFPARKRIGRIHQNSGTHDCGFIYQRTQRQCAPVGVPQPDCLREPLLPCKLTEQKSIAMKTIMRTAKSGRGAIAWQIYRNNMLVRLQLLHKAGKCFAGSKHSMNDEERRLAGIRFPPLAERQTNAADKGLAAFELG